MGEKLRYYRIHRGYSQSKLAKKCGISFQQIQKYEKGYNRVSAGRLYSLSVILNVPITDFFDSLDKYNNLDTNISVGIALMYERELITAFNKIKEVKIRKNLLHLIESL